MSERGGKEREDKTTEGLGDNILFPRNGSDCRILRREGINLEVRRSGGCFYMVHLMVQYATLIFITADWNCVCVSTHHIKQGKGWRGESRRSKGRERQL